MEQVLSGAVPRLSEFLRVRRRHGAQRAIAAAGHISVRRYRKLENGEAGTIGLDVLLRVSASLGLSRNEESQFLELARPDLGFVLSGRDSPASARRWRSLHKVASRLRQAKGARDALRTAVEILHASFGPELSAFAVERHPRRAPRVAFVIGRPVDPAHLPDAAARGELIQQTLGDRSVAYAPMHRDGATFGGIGLASIPGADLRATSLPFLLMVAALLETQLNNRAFAGLPQSMR